MEKEQALLRCLLEAIYIMRATSLEFRSPKEKTGEFDWPCVTGYGTLLFTGKKCMKTDFGKGKRFRQYEIDAKMNEGVGPGSYNLREEIEGIKAKNWKGQKSFGFADDFRWYNLEALFKEYSSLKTVGRDKSSCGFSLEIGK